MYEEFSRSIAADIEKTEALNKKASEEAAVLKQDRLRKVAARLGAKAIYGAGGAGAGALTNYLLGNKSLLSYALMGGGGALAGVAAEHLLNSKVPTGLSRYNKLQEAAKARGVTLDDKQVRELYAHANRGPILDNMYTLAGSTLGAGLYATQLIKDKPQAGQGSELANTNRFGDRWVNNLRNRVDTALLDNPEYLKARAEVERLTRGSQSTILNAKGGPTAVPGGDALRKAQQRLDDITEAAYARAQRGYSAEAAARYRKPLPQGMKAKIQYLRNNYKNVGKETSKALGEAAAAGWRRNVGGVGRDPNRSRAQTVARVALYGAPIVLGMGMDHLSKAHDRTMLEASLPQLPKGVTISDLIKDFKE